MRQRRIVPRSADYRPEPAEATGSRARALVPRRRAEIGAAIRHLCGIVAHTSIQLKCGLPSQSHGVAFGRFPLCLSSDIINCGSMDAFVCTTRASGSRTYKSMFKWFSSSAHCSLDSHRARAPSPSARCLSQPRARAVERRTRDAANSYSFILYYSMSMFVRLLTHNPLVLSSRSLSTAFPSAFHTDYLLYHCHLDLKSGSSERRRRWQQQRWRRSGRQAGISSHH